MLKQKNKENGLVRFKDASETQVAAQASGDGETWTNSKQGNWLLLTAITVIGEMPSHKNTSLFISVGALISCIQPIQTLKGSEGTMSGACI